MGRLLHVSGNWSIRHSSIITHKTGANAPGRKEKSMKTYYCVTSSFDDRGRATANITDMIKAEEKPESTYTSARRKDIYNDWFESEKEAQEYVEQTRIA